MLRPALLLLALLAPAFASPAAAQSLGLVKLPAVFVSQPVVQQMHRGVAIAPISRAASTPIIAAVSIASPSVYAPAPAAPQFVPRPVPQPQSYSAIPARFPTVDTSLRNYSNGIAQYGPFRVMDENRAALVGETDAASPRWFSVMLRRHPELSQLDMVECPGTRDDIANLKVGRMIRAAGIATHVPRRGSVRSGAVELFLAGAVRDIADGAEFAVHSWMDEHGREAMDFGADAPQNRRYLAYYREMGMSERDAREFYNFTNSVPHRDARWLGAREMRRWTGDGASERDQPQRARQIAYAGV